MTAGNGEIWVGIFGPSREEKRREEERLHQERLRSYPIAPVLSWRQHLEGRVPEYHEMINAALQRAGRSPGDVDVAEMHVRARAGVETVLRGLAERLTTLNFVDIQIVLSRPDYGSALLADYLSTCGAQGIVAYNKLAELVTDGIPDTLAQELRKGTFDRLSDDPAQLARVIGSAGVNPPAGDPSVVLPDPGGPTDDLRQMAYQLFKSCGLAVLMFGQLPLEHLVGVALHNVPALRNTEVRGGVGFLIGHEGKLWMGYEGPWGSLVVYFGGDGDGEFIRLEVLKPVSAIGGPVQWGLGVAGAQVPAAAAQILESARPVPLWELAPFAHQRPAEAPAIPDGLGMALQPLGWQPTGSGGYKLDVPLRRGGTQAVFFTPYGAASFAVIAPLGKSVHGAVPESLRNRLFGRYSVEVVADMVVLCDRVPTGPQPPDPYQVTDAARVIALYAEDQFAPGPRPPVAPPPAAPNPHPHHPGPYPFSPGAVTPPRNSQPWTSGRY